MQISVMKCPHQCQVNPVRAGQVALIQEAEGEEEEEEKSVLVVQEAKDLEEEQQRGATGPALTNCPNLSS